MDKIKTKLIAAEVLHAIKEIGEKHECEIAYKGGSYDDNAATIKFEFAERAADGMVMTKMATDFQRYAESVGLKPEDLGRTFDRHGETYKIVGFKPRATKMPVIVEKLAGGGRYKLREDDVKRHLAAG